MSGVNNGLLHHTISAINEFQENHTVLAVCHWWPSAGGNRTVCQVATGLANQGGAALLSQQYCDPSVLLGK